MDWVYLDNNATTRPTPQVVAAVAEAYESLWANPSSVHRFGQAVRQRLELARAEVAKLIGAKPRELVLTSGGTEANHLALAGLLEVQPEATLLTTPIEHAAVREPAEARKQDGRRVEWLTLGDGGVIDLPALRDRLADGDGPVLLSVIWANNETGVIQPMAEIAAAVSAARGAGRKVWLHTDATQAVGKLPVDVKPLGVDLLSFAGHKFHGPKGVGGLWVRRGVRLRPQLRGGPQERELRGGTENVPAIVGLGVAAEQARAWLDDPSGAEAGAKRRDRLETAIHDRLVEAGLTPPVVNSGEAPRLWNTSNLALRGLEAEAILLGLSERGVCASAGAACSSGSLEPSPILRAMGVPEPLAHGSIRLSLSRFSTDAEIDAAADTVAAVIARLARVMPMTT
jgi:cysteine desulfurase